MNTYLPIDLLGLEILKDIVANNEWNSGNWLNMADYSLMGVRALAEAWNWLFATGLVAHDPKQTAADAIFVTRLGHQVAETSDLTRLRIAARLTVDLHPALEPKVRPQFLMGEFELAAFAAMKVVEVRVREMAGASDSDIGYKLMHKVFGEGGALCDKSLDSGERNARRELFAGAIGTIKNPTSHRDVRYDDPMEASEAILLADLLMRILDRIPTVS